MIKRVSEVVTIEEIKQWSIGDIITIEAGTGVGKSYFIKNILYAHAKLHNKKILFLIHRTNCVNQFQTEIDQSNKNDIIHIKTYQSLEAQYKHNKPFDFSPYQYIVCDEFHYFMSDAAFNKTTDISLNSILSQSNIIRIFMSATGNYMTRYISNYKKLTVKTYELPINFSFIKELTFFNKDNTMEQFILEAIDRKDKAIFFIQSAQKAYELYSKFKDHALFNCSKNNTKYYKHVDEDKINQMLHNEHFEELILITTTCMDTGVNIIDEQLKHIVCDVKDTGTLIQCIGRKRLQHNDDGLYLYIKSINNQQLGGMQTQLNKKLEMARYLKEHTVQEYIEKYPREFDYSNIVYDDIVDDPDKGTKKINELMYFKCLLDSVQVDEMKTYGNFGYCKYLAVKFGKYDSSHGYNYRLIEEDNKIMELDIYLENIVSKKLLKHDQHELVNKIDLRVNGRQQKSYKKLNEGLDMINLPFVILPKKSNDTRYWIVEKIDKK
jgi:hypothetical protein